MLGMTLLETDFNDKLGKKRQSENNAIGIMNFKLNLM
jgi:hypothetical protein